MTTALWILLGVALALTALNLMRVGVDAEYDGETFFLRIKAGPVNIAVLPKKDKPKKTKKEKKRPDKPPKEPKEKREKTPPSLSMLLKLARLALEAANTFRRKLQMDLFRLHLILASDDPYDTAMLYARVRAGLESLYPLAARTLTIKERDVRLAADFTQDKTRAAARVMLTIRIGQIVGIALVFACRALPLLVEWLKSRKKMKSNRAGSDSAERTVSNG